MHAGAKKKYMQIGWDYETVSMPGLYIAGTAAHSLDWRKSAGGFIHGFRYTGEIGLILGFYASILWVKCEFAFFC